MIRLIAAVLLVVFSCNAVWARVLVVHSYHPAYQWTAEINSAIVKELVVAGMEHRVIFLDTKRNPGMDFRKEAACKAHDVIAAYKPKVVIAVDDNVQDCVVRPYVNKSDIQFVFCGVNADPGKYGYPAPNVTGILERLYPGQTLQMLKALMPIAEQVAVVSDDSTTTKSILPRIKKKAHEGALVLPIREYVQPATFSQWREAILRLDQDPDIDALLIPLYHTVKIDNTQQSMAPMEVMQWTVDNASKPVLGVWSFSVEDGALFAVTVDPREHGREAARMAMEILRGKPAGELPMRVNREGYVIVNLKHANRFNLDANINIELIADRIIK